MKSSVKNLENSRVVITIDAPADEISGEYDKIVSALMKNATAKGFRKGHAPRAIIEKNYGDMISEEFTQKVFGAQYRAALKENSLEPEAIVSTENVKVSKDEGFHAEITLDVRPTFDVPDYKGIRVEARPVEVTDAAVGERVEELRGRLMNFEEVEADKDTYCAVDGDGAKVRYEAFADGGTLDGKVADSGKALAKAEDAWIYVGKDAPARIPGMGEALIGKKVGEQGEFDATFTDDETAEDFKGRTVHYKYAVAGIRRHVLPELNDDFAKRLGMENMDALRAKVRELATTEAETAEQVRVRDEAVKSLMNGVDFALPASVVEDEERAEISRIVNTSMQQGLTREQIEKSKDEIAKVAKENATKRVRLNYVLLAIGEAEKILPTNEDINQQINAIAASTRQAPEKVRELIAQRGRTRDLMNDIVCRKALDLVVESAKKAK